jgi:DNA-binding NtrC family response regulator
MSLVRVLVVDEDTDVLELTEAFLEREAEDLDVRTEADPRDAVDRVAAEDVDCVVTDLRMPGLDGIELATRVADGEGVPVFLFTAADDPATAERVEEAPVADVVRKGVGTDHYAKLASRILAAVGE